MGEGRLHELPDQSGLVARRLGLQPPPAARRRPARRHGPRLRGLRQRPPRPGAYRAAARRDHRPGGRPLDRAAYRTRSRPGPDPDAIARAAALLRDAKHPFVVLGGGTAGAADAARALVERLGAPVALTINAKGVLPPAHPLSLGSTLPLPPVLEALQAADVVLAIGTELGETDTLLFGQAARARRQADPHRHRGRADDPQRAAGGRHLLGRRPGDAGAARRPRHAGPRPGRGAGGAPARRGGRRPARGLPDARPHSRRRRRGAPRRDHRRRFHPAGLRRQPRLRARPGRGRGSTPPPATARSATACRRPSAPSSPAPTRRSWR